MKLSYTREFLLEQAKTVLFQNQCQLAQHTMSRSIKRMMYKNAKKGKRGYDPFFYSISEDWWIANRQDDIRFLKRFIKTLSNGNLLDPIVLDETEAKTLLLF